MYSYKEPQTSHNTEYLSIPETVLSKLSPSTTVVALPYRLRDDALSRDESKSQEPLSQPNCILSQIGVSNSLDCCRASSSSLLPSYGSSL